MAVEIESQIMREIGFGQHYHHWNGSDSCAIGRMRAAARLSDAISNHVSAGGIVSPNSQLMRLVGEIAEHGDVEAFSLTNTWSAASDVIRAHINAAQKEPARRKDYFRKIAKEIAKQYLPEERSATFLSGEEERLLSSEEITAKGSATARLKDERAKAESSMGGGLAI